jgi:hypothetical protein
VSYFSAIDTALVMESSAVIHRITIGDIVQRMLHCFDFPHTFVPILERLPRCGDSPKLRHWVAVSTSLLRSKLKSLDPDPRFVTHFFVDSLDAGRIAELHALRALEIVVEDCITGEEEFSWSDPTIQCPRSFNVWGLGTMCIPDVGKGVDVKVSTSELSLNLGGATTSTGIDLQREVAAATGGASLTPALRISTPYGSTILPLDVAGLADSYHSNAPIVRGIDANRKWIRIFREAIEIIAEQDSKTVQDCLRLAPAVLVLHAGGTSYGSSSPQEVMGLVFLPGVSDPYDVAECLVHEALHQKLFRVEEGAPLFHEEHGDEEIYYSPWRSDARPLRMLVHGAFVFAGVAHHWRSILSRAKDADAISGAAFHVYYRARQAQIAMDIVNRFDHRTAMGNAISGIISSGVQEALADIDVPPAIRSEAERRIHEHRSKFNRFIG